MNEKSIEISVDKQELYCLSDQECVATYAISTASRGAGQMQGSFQTPLGKHTVRAKIGADLPLNCVFVGRRPTGEIWDKQLNEQYPGRDWILTRILWLSGTERGFNRLGDVDTMRRYIYIHGTPEEADIGAPTSHGCIRMRNLDMVSLFNWTDVGTPVTIQQKVSA